MADEFSLTQLIRVVWRRKVLVALVTVVCVVTAGAVTIALPKIYRAQTSVFFPESRDTGLTAALGSLGQAAGVSAALARLGPSSAAASLCKAIADSYSARAEICREYGLQERFETETFQDATDQLRDSTWTAITPEGLLLIRVDTTDPRLSADLANAYARIVERVYREGTVSRARGEREFLERRVAQAETDLRTFEAELEDYQKRGEALLAPDEVAPILEKLADIRIEQATAEVELESAQRRRAELVTQLSRLAAENPQGSESGSVYAVPWEMTSETLSDNPETAAIRAELVSLEVQLAAARHDLSDEHPEVKRLQSRIEETRSRLASEARKTLTAETRTRSPVYASALEQLVSLETAVIGQEARVQGLQELVNQVEGRSGELPERLLHYSRLQREVRAQEQVYITIGTQLEAARLRELQEQPVFEVLDKAVPPERHDRPKLVVNLVVGLLFGLFLGTAVAAALGPPAAKAAA
ncbi:MAG: hypothetical protein JSV65_19705 [Armatimonadota bacterium]|nr:MAG: hypothetical protein JSV65_19705 [Armatimonadota bacterium]